MDLYIKGGIPKNRLLSAQHTYSKVKSIDTVLYSVMSWLKGALINIQDDAVGTFLDIEDAFNNVRPMVVIRSLNNFEVEANLKHIIYSFICDRTVGQGDVLWLILDRNRSWKPNIEESVRKAAVALYCCREFSSHTCEGFVCGCIDFIFILALNVIIFRFIDNRILLQTYVLTTERFLVAVFSICHSEKALAY